MRPTCGCEAVSNLCNVWGNRLSSTPESALSSAYKRCIKSRTAAECVISFMKTYSAVRSRFFLRYFPVSY